MKVWASDDTVLVGTKCNRLLELNLRTGSKQEVPIGLRQSDPAVAATHIEDSSKCGIHSMAISPTGEYLATGGAEPRHAVILKMPTHIGGAHKAPTKGEGKDAAPSRKSRFEHLQTMTVRFLMPVLLR